MTPRILLVDDEPRVLDGLRRSLRDRDVVTAPGPAEALELLDRDDFAVVVSDLQMPDMSGIEFLARVRDRRPDTIRIMLTGQADLQASIDAVNEGRVFRFLTKPCRTDDLVGALDDALEHHRLVRAERELLEGTVAGTVDVLVEVIGLADPIAAERSARVRTVMRVVAEGLGFAETWEFELAGSLCLIGAMTLPDDLRSLVVAGRSTQRHETAARHAAAAETLIGRVPRLGRVARIVGGQIDPPPVPDFTADDSDDAMVAGGGAVMLAAVLAHDTLAASGMAWDDAARAVATRRSDALWQAVLEIVSTDAEPDVRWRSARIRVADVSTGMVFTDDVFARNRTKLVAAGATVTPAVLERLQTFAEGIGVAGPLQVRIPHYA